MVHCISRESLTVNGESTKEKFKSYEDKVGIFCGEAVSAYGECGTKGDVGGEGCFLYEWEGV